MNSMHPPGGTVRGLKHIETVSTVYNDDGSASKEYQVLHYQNRYGVAYQVPCLVEHIDLTKHTPGQPYSPRRCE